MPYAEAKVYNDGSHFIAIPHTTNPYKRRKKLAEEQITVKNMSADNSIIDENEDETDDFIEETQLSFFDEETEPVVEEKSEQETEIQVENEVKPRPSEGVKMTRKQLFDKLYDDNINLPRARRQAVILAGMRPYFRDEDSAVKFVTENMERKLRNLITRRIRLTRKVNLQEFNYFVTFTYNDAIHTEETFKKKLRSMLGRFSFRKGWKYIGVWERSPKKKRLHFHGIFYIPEGTLPGVMTNVESYSFSERRRQITHQNDYFNSLFGRNDFREIENKNHIGEAVAYILKYIEKSGEKIVYSRGLPQYFISDIMEEDVVCPCGLEDKKLLLFDDFACWDEGCYVGTVSKETIKQMRKSN